MNENETNESGSSDVASFVGSVAKDIAVTVAGTVVALGLLHGVDTAFKKIQARRNRVVIEVPVPTEN